MKRFWLGLLGGGLGAGATWLISDHHVGWTVGVGVLIAVLVWFGEYLDEVLP